MRAAQSESPAVQEAERAAERANWVAAGTGKVLKQEVVGRLAKEKEPQAEAAVSPGVVPRETAAVETAAAVEGTAAVVVVVAAEMGVAAAEMGVAAAAMARVAAEMVTVDTEARH